MLTDTTPEAEAFWLDRIRQMTPSEKLRHVFGQIEFGLSLHRAGVRFRMPNASKADRDRAFVQELYGEEAVRTVFGK